MQNGQIALMISDLALLKCPFPSDGSACVAVKGLNYRHKSDQTSPFLDETLRLPELVQKNKQKCQGKEVDDIQ